MKINSVLVVGSGTMGRGIAQWFLQTGAKVTLTDANPKVLDLAKELLTKSFDQLVTKKKFTQTQTQTFLKNLNLHSLDQLNSDYDLALECIIENIEAKIELFKTLDSKLKPSCLFASNTSSLSISRMGKELTEGRRKNFFGIHFFNPAPIMKLVEIIESSFSDKSQAQELLKFFDAAGKVAVLCQDSPGFIVNRVARNFYGEAFRIAKYNDQTRYKEIDKIMSEVGGFKMGPFALMDLIGIDVNLDVTTSVWKDFFCEPRFAPHHLQKKMVDSGRLGLKTKRGFYDYE